MLVADVVLLANPVYLVPTAEKVQLAEKVKPVHQVLLEITA